MVVLSTPGMLHGGLSLTIFEEWCTNELNMIIMPGLKFALVLASII
jgi:integrator complex subunit 11